MADDKIPGMEYWERYTDQQLHDAFDLVKNKANWKLAIDAEVPITTDLTLLTDAVIYFTGSVPEFVQVDEKTYHVMAAGYYASIGS